MGPNTNTVTDDYDPNAALDEIRKRVAMVDTDLQDERWQDAAISGGLLADALDHLDHWLTNKNTLPTAWEDRQFHVVQIAAEGDEPDDVYLFEDNDLAWDFREAKGRVGDVTLHQVFRGEQAQRIIQHAKKEEGDE